MARERPRFESVMVCRPHSLQPASGDGYCRRVGISFVISKGLANSLSIRLAQRCAETAAAVTKACAMRVGCIGRVKAGRRTGADAATVHR